MVITNEKALKTFLSLNPIGAIDVILEQSLPLELDPREQYARIGDGDPNCYLEVNVSENLDARIISRDGIAIRDIVEVLFCPEGRGESPMVRNALAILAYAIKRSNEIRPQ